jgi:hypothetical protein
MGGLVLWDSGQHGLSCANGGGQTSVQKEMGRGACVSWSQASGWRRLATAQRCHTGFSPAAVLPCATCSCNYEHKQRAHLRQPRAQAKGAPAQARTFSACLYRSAASPRLPAASRTAALASRLSASRGMAAPTGPSSSRRASLNLPCWRTEEHTCWRAGWGQEGGGGRVQGAAHCTAKPSHALSGCVAGWPGRPPGYTAAAASPVHAGCPGTP